MKKINQFFLLLFLLISCKGHGDKELYKKIHNSLYEWSLTGDTVHLEKAYKAIIKSEEYQQEGFNENNINFFMPIFINLKKYEKIDSLLKKIKTNDKSFYDKVIMIQLYNQYTKTINSTNPKTADYYIKKIIAFNKDKIKQNPTDTAYYFDYFIFKSKINKLDKLIPELDSIKEKKYFSKEYYEFIKQEMKHNPY